MVPAVRGVGFGQVIGTASVVSYYCCLIALALHYMGSSCQSVLSWTVCHPDLSEDNMLCITSGTNNTQNSDNLTIISAAEQYFKRGVLKSKDDISDGIGMPDLQLTVCLAACWVLLFSTSGKVSPVQGRLHTSPPSFLM